MEREVGGGIGMGNTCKPMAVSFQCMTKSTTKKKKEKKKNWLFTNPRNQYEVCLPCTPEFVSSWDTEVAHKSPQVTREM